MKAKEKPTPEEQIKINTINLFAETSGYDVYMTAEYLTRSIDCKTTRYRKKKEKPTPDELIKIQALKFFTEQGDDVYMVIQKLIRGIDCKVTRSRKKKQLIELYNKYINITE